MPRVLRHSAVLGTTDVALESEEQAQQLVAEGMLFEGFTERFDVRWGVMPGFTLADVRERLARGTPAEMATA